MLRACQAIQHRIGKTHTRFALFLQVLIDACRAASPEGRSCTCPSDDNPASRRTPGGRDGTIHRVTSGRVGIRRDIRYLAVAIAVLILHSRTRLPAGFLEGVTETAAAASSLGAALCVRGVAPHGLTAIGAIIDLEVGAADAGNVGITRGRIDCQVGIITVIGTRVARGGKHGDALRGSLLKNGIQRLQFRGARSRLTFTPADGGNLRFIVCDDLVVGVVHALRRVWPLVNDLSCFGCHCRYNFDIQFDLDSSLPGGAIKAIHQHIADTRAAEVVGLQVLSYITALIAIQLKYGHRLVIAQNPCLLEWTRVIGCHQVGGLESGLSVRLSMRRAFT